MSSIRVVELFAGVGGFRLGLEGVPEEIWETPLLKNGKTGFKVIWSNQWEPPTGKQKSEPKQWASMVYEKRFGKTGHDNRDIEIALPDVPDHDLLVGGFPCQDYSVARTISGELGIDGEKGKLWTSIQKIMEQKSPKLVLLENVPRLLTSPSRQRGLNFAKIGTDLLNLGYDFEWRVIDAGKYGMPQRRKRVFVLAYHPDFSPLRTSGFDGRPSKKKAARWLSRDGPFAEAFGVKAISTIPGHDTWPDVESMNEDDFSRKSRHFKKSGICFSPKNWGKRPRMYTIDLVPTSQEPHDKLANHLLRTDDPNYNGEYVVTTRLDQWDYVKGQRKEYRIRKKDAEWAKGIKLNLKQENLWELYRYYMDDITRWAHLSDAHKAIFEENLGTNSGVYRYSEGRIGRDDITKPSRTIVTAEIGKSPSRSRHLFEFQGKVRRLQPIECERLNQFPDDWTKIDSIPDSRRGFLMGNALVIGIIHRLRRPIRKILTPSDDG